MNVNELKPGDWVIFPNENKPCRIEEINSQFVDGLYCGRCYIKDLEPVPLTEEILLKNGWICSIGLDYNFLPYNKFCKYGLTLDEYTDGVFSVDYGNLRTKITYVHELQHLLWVFNKGDIELLKEF